MFPVICLPFSLLVGLLVKYAKAPSNLDGSILDSLTGDVSNLKWRDLPAMVATSLASLFSGAVLGPEGAIGNIASKIAALYCDLFRIPADRRPKLVFASVASGYNGLLENPVFAAVLGTEVAETKQQGLSTLPASLIGGGVGYAIFLLLHETGFVNFLHLPPVQSYSVWDAFLMVPLALVGLALAILTGVFMKVSAGVFGRLKERVVLRALVAGAIFSVVGVFAPVLMFSGETQTQTVIKGAAGYGIALLLVMAVGKLALLSVGFKSGFLGGPTFPLIFASTSVALALNIAFPGRAAGDPGGRHHDRGGLRPVPDPADGRPPHGLHAGCRPDHGGAHRARHRHRDDRHPASAEAHGRAAGEAWRRRSAAEGDVVIQAIGDILPLAIGIAISPVPIIAIILMLITPKARSNGLAFLGGWVLGLAIIGTIVLVVANTAGVATSSGPSKTVSAIKLALGLLLLFAAWRQFRKRPAHGEEAPMPKWMKSLDGFTPTRSLAIGALLSGVNPKNLALNATAAAGIAATGLPGVQQAVVLLVLIVVASVGVAAPVGVYFLMGDRATSVLDSWKAWLAANNATVMTVLLLVFGVVLIGKGIGGL